MKEKSPINLCVPVSYGHDLAFATLFDTKDHLVMRMLPHTIFYQKYYRVS